MSEDHPDWIWYGVGVDGKPIVSFGRWQSHMCQKRYKLAEIQPTEHDHPKPAEGWQLGYFIGDNEAFFHYVKNGEKIACLTIDPGDDNEPPGIGYALLGSDGKYRPGKFDPLKEPGEFAKEILDHIEAYNGHN